MTRTKSTTVIAVRRGKQVTLAGDGQVTLGDVVLKQSAQKLRTLYHDQVIAGFAGTAADTLTLFERFEKQLKRLRVDTEVFIGGSDAKDTLIKKGVYDVDVFVRFDAKVKNFSEVCERVLKSFVKIGCRLYT